MTTQADMPAGPVAISSVPEEEWGHGERFESRFRHLTRAMLGDDYHVGVVIEELPPGKQSCPLHYHMLEEEHVLILEGRCTLRLGEKRIEMKPGDYMAFPAGAKVGHCLVNETDAPCRYVLVGERRPNEVCVYPDSNKIGLRWLDERYDRAAVRDYWDGED